LRELTCNTRRENKFLKISRNSLSSSFIQN